MYVNSYRLRSGNYPPSAVLLAELLGYQLIQTPTPPTLTVNWGKTLESVPEEHVLINAFAPLQKLLAFKKLFEKKVRIPKYQELGTWIVRKHRHSQGRDILTSDDAFLVEGLPKTKEIRLDVCRKPDGTMGAFRLHEKVPLRPDEFVWNRANSEWRSWGTREMVNQLGDRTPIEMAKQAVEALQFDFGAVDLIQPVKGGVWFVLEVNSAPNLKEAGATKYAERIRRLMNARSAGS